MGFFRQEYWSRLPFPCLGDLPDPGIEPGSPALQGGFLNPTGPPGKLPGCFLKLDTFFTAIKILKGLFREAGEGRIGSSGLADADQHMYHG